MAVFLSNLQTSLGLIYDSLEAIDLIYPASICGESVNRLARKFVQKTEIKRRSSTIDLTKLPDKYLTSDRYRPAVWGRDLFNKVVPSNLLAEIGHILTVYNISSHQNVLPSISAQIVNKLNLSGKILPMDMPYLGCAGGLFALQQAVDLARTTEKAVFVYIFDECLYTSNICRDKKDDFFRPSLIANSIFSDGAVAFLVLPESLHHLISEPQIEILDVCTSFIAGEEIYMEGSIFILGDEVSKVIPPKVADLVINPLLNRNKLTLSEIKEWSIHQGGKTVLSQFAKSEILGLTAEQLQPSFESFYEYGNFSAPSCFFVLKKFFYRHSLQPKSNNLGAIVGFGSGYYLGASLYRWVG